MKYNIEWARKKALRNDKLRFVFFWGHRPSKDGSITSSCFSQWWSCDFTVDGIKYHTAEQYMMAQKALLFGDKEIFQQIMDASHPKIFKELGRKVKGFDHDIWEKNCVDIVIKGNTAKFSQNSALGAYLLSTKDCILVEASPYDRIWGIGMKAGDQQCQNPIKWHGTNLLGFCLMEVRDILMQERKYQK